MWLILALVVLAVVVARWWRRFSAEFDLIKLLESSTVALDLREAAWNTAGDAFQREHPWLEPRLTADERSDLLMMIAEEPTGPGYGTGIGVGQAHSAVQDLRQRGYSIKSSLRLQRKRRLAEEASDIFPGTYDDQWSGRYERDKYVEARLREIEDHRE